MDNGLPKIRIEKVLDAMDAVDSEGEAIPFDIVYIGKKGQIVEYKQARLARNVKRELSLQQRRGISQSSHGQRSLEYKRKSVEFSIKKLYIKELDPPFRNCWFRSIMFFNGREVVL